MLLIGGKSLRQVKECLCILKQWMYFFYLNRTNQFTSWGMCYNDGLLWSILKNRLPHPLTCPSWSGSNFEEEVASISQKHIKLLFRRKTTPSCREKVHLGCRRIHALMGVFLCEVMERSMGPLNPPECYGVWGSKLRNGVKAPPVCLQMQISTLRHAGQGFFWKARPPSPWQPQ